MTEEAGEFDIWVFIPEKLRLFQIDPEIQLEGRGAVQPFPTGDDQLLFFDGTAFENRNVGKVDNLELFVQFAKFFPSRSIQDYPQGTLLIGMRRQKDNRLCEIGILQTRVRKEYVAREAGGSLKSLSEVQNN